MARVLLVSRTFAPYAVAVALAMRTSVGVIVPRATTSSAS